MAKDQHPSPSAGSVRACDDMVAGLHAFPCVPFAAGLSSKLQDCGTTLIVALS